VTDNTHSSPHHWRSAGDALAFLRNLAQKGGPTVEQHGLLTSCFLQLGKDRVPFEAVREALRITISTTDCIQGFGFMKPHGYSGDFEMIDRIYTFWKSQDPNLRNWDEYFHAQPAPRAVRNRKGVFHQLLKETEEVSQTAEIRVLDLASGPCRDVYEYLPKSRAIFECVDLDQKAIDFAKALCRFHAGRVMFRRSNVLRLRLHRRYDLIWCAGLFDYFPDRLFVRVLCRLVPHIKPGGKLVIGNFGNHNSSRYWMEAVGDWRLNYRSEEELVTLGQKAGIEIDRLRIHIEAENIILFLHVAGQRT
jgi:SAM-dependent methyltransferase